VFRLEALINAYRLPAFQHGTLPSATWHFSLGGLTMTIPEARHYIGRSCNVTWKDRHSKEKSTRLKIKTVSYVPLYGAFLMGDVEDVCLSKVTSIQLIG